MEYYDEISENGSRGVVKLKKSLVVLLSEQLMPVLLSVKTLEPDEVFVVYTEEKYFKGLKQTIRDKINIPVHEIQIGKSPYNFSEIYQTLYNRLKNLETEIVFDVTEGTKIMSLAACEVARSLGCDTYYVNTDNMELLCLTDPARNKKIPEINVELILSMHRSIHDPTDFIPPGEISFSAGSDNRYDQFVEHIIGELVSQNQDERLRIRKLGRNVIRIYVSSRAKLHVIEISGRKKVEASDLRKLREDSEMLGGKRTETYLALDDEKEDLSPKIKARAQNENIKFIKYRDVASLLAKLLNTADKKELFNYNKVLVSIVSDQAIPNIIAAEAFRPDLHVLLLTDAGRYLHIASRIISALKDIDSTYITRNIDPYDPQSVVKALDGIPGIKHAEQVVVNITGGTKIMAIGAINWCAAHDISAVYVDTEDRMLIRVRESSSCPPCLPDTIPSLSLEHFALAHGVTIVGGNREQSPFKPNEHVIDNLKDYLYRNEKTLKNYASIALNEIDCWKRLVGGKDKAPDVPEDKYNKFLKKMAGLGIIKSSFNNTWRINEGPKTSLIKELPQLGKYGTPLELWVYYHLVNRKEIEDLRWGVDLLWASPSGETVGNEVDILAVARSRLSVISCKLGDNVDSGEIPKVKELANQMGGTFARAAVVLTEKGLENLLKNGGDKWPGVAFFKYEDLKRSACKQLIAYICG